MSPLKAVALLASGPFLGSLISLLPWQLTESLILGIAIGVTIGTVLFSSGVSTYTAQPG